MRENKKLNTGILHFVQDDDVRRGGSIFEPRKAWSARKRGTPFGIPPFLALFSFSSGIRADVPDPLIEKLKYRDRRVQIPSATKFVNRSIEMTAALPWESGNVLCFPSFPWQPSKHLSAGLSDALLHLDLESTILHFVQDDDVRRGGIAYTHLEFALERDLSGELERACVVGERKLLLVELRRIDRVEVSRARGRDRVDGVE
jgi:hypothetical protein